MKNKKIGAGLLTLGLLIGGGAMVAKQINAQSSTVITPDTNTTGDIKTTGDTDTIQDVGGIEKPDSTEKVTSKTLQTKETESETNDTDGGVNEDAN
jgi:hypothetical protein